MQPRRLNKCQLFKTSSKAIPNMIEAPPCQEVEKHSCTTRCTHHWETKNRGGGVGERRVQISNLIKQKGKTDLRGQTCQHQTLREFTGGTQPERPQQRWECCHLHHGYHFMTQVHLLPCKVQWTILFNVNNQLGKMHEIPSIEP